MPVHRIRFERGRIQEQYVVTDQRSAQTESRLAVIWDQASSSGLGEYIERLNIRLREGQVIEVNLGAIVWLARMAKAIDRGFLITIDYGDESAHLYGPGRIHGTLRSFYRHRLIDSPLERVGEQDLTASVNFSALIEYGRDLGFEMVSYERQTAFLVRNGLIERIAEMYGSTDTVDDLNERLAVKNLFAPGGVSDNFRVLIQKKL
jgi:SAM-dependent MidA family methyltransferase